MSDRHNLPSPHAERAAQFWPPPEDEISLFEIWDALLRRRWLIVGTAATITILAAANASLRPDVYAYRTAVEVGTYVNSIADANPKGESRLQFLETPAAVERKLEHAYVPAARRALDRPEEPAPKVEIRAPDQDAGAGLLVLYSEATPENAARVREVQQRIVERLEAAHERILTPIESRQRNRLEQASARLAFLQRREVERSRIQPLEQVVANAERKLAALDTQHRADRLELRNALSQKRREAEQLEDREKQLQAEIKRMDDRRVLTETQLASQRDLVAQLEDARRQATAEVESSPDSMAVLTIGAQLDRARKRADDLEARLQIGLPAQRDKLQANLLDNRRARQRATDEIDALKARLKDLEETYQRDRGAAEHALSAARTALAKGRADYEKALQDQQRAVQIAQLALQELTPTRPLFVAERDLRPAGPGTLTIIALGAILGSMLGIFGAFGAEFVSAAARRRKVGEDVPDTTEGPRTMELFPVDGELPAGRGRFGTYG